MSYLDLAERLKQLARNLEQHHDQLEGVALSKSAATLHKALGGFAVKLEDFLGGAGPGIRELQDLLKSPAARKHLTLPALKIVFRQLLSKSLLEETPAKAKTVLFKEIKNKQKGEEAVAYLKDFFRQAAAPSKLGDDKASLQQEFLRLGSLDPEELEYELSLQRKTISTLKRLAKANAIVVTSETTRERLVQEIIRYAQRAHRNVSF